MGEITKSRHDVIKRYKGAEHVIIVIRKPHVFCLGVDMQFDLRETIELRVYIDRDMANCNYGVVLNATQRNGSYFPHQFHVRDRQPGMFTLVVQNMGTVPAIVDLNICVTGLIDAPKQRQPSDA